MLHSIAILTRDDLAERADRVGSVLSDSFGADILIGTRWRTTPTGAFVIVAGAYDDGREVVAQPDTIVFAGITITADQQAAAEADGQHVHVIGDSLREWAGVVADISREV